MSSFERVTGGYFDVIGNPIIKGRGITEQDTATSRHVAVINEAFAKKFFKHEDPIGKHFGRTELGAARQYEIVGVAKDARYLTYHLDRPIEAFFFLPEAQHDVFPECRIYTSGDVRSHFLYNVAIVDEARSRTYLHFRGAPGHCLCRSEYAGEFHSSRLREQVAGQFSQQRLIARLTSFFGILSLVLASIGAVRSDCLQRRTPHQ